MSIIGNRARSMILGRVGLLGGVSLDIVFSLAGWRAFA